MNRKKLLIDGGGFIGSFIAFVAAGLRASAPLFPTTPRWMESHETLSWSLVSNRFFELSYISKLSAQA